MVLRALITTLLRKGRACRDKSKRPYGHAIVVNTHARNYRPIEKVLYVRPRFRPIYVYFGVNTFSVYDFDQEIPSPPILVLSFFRTTKLILLVFVYTLTREWTSFVFAFQLSVAVGAQRHDIQTSNTVQVQGRPEHGLGSRISRPGGRRRRRVVQQGQTVQGAWPATIRHIWYDITVIRFSGTRVPPPRRPRATIPPPSRCFAF